MSSVQMGDVERGRIEARSERFMSADAAAFFRENGYLVASGALSGDEVAALNADAAKICRGEYGTYRGWNGPHDRESDEAVLQRYLCVHFPHKISALMKRTLAHPAITQVLTRVIGSNVKCMQSMLFIKAAGKPGQPWHQDEDYIPTRDRSLTGAWIALDDATVENGCLWVIPASHRPGILWPQQAHHDRRFDCAEESVAFPYSDDEAVPVEVEAGSIVFFNGYLLHRSLPNRAATGYRRVLVNHYMSCESHLPWHRPPEGTSIAKADERDVEIVAGEDPYRWKGYTDVHVPHVRPSGEGGCGDARKNLKQAE